MDEPKAVVNWEEFLANDNESLQAQNKGLQNKIFELKNLVYSVKDENAKLKDNVKSLTDQVTERCDKVRQLNTENEQLTANCDSITDEYWELVAEHDKLYESYNKALTDIGVLKASLKAQIVSDYGASTDDRDYRIKQLRDENASLKNDIACYNKIIDDLEAKINSAHYPDSKVEELERQLKASQDARARQANQLTSQQEVLRQRSDDICKLVDKVKKLNDETSEWIDRKSVV